MNIAVPGKTAGMAGKPFPAGNVQTWGRRSWNHLFWKRPPSSSSPLRCTRLQERSGCICFSLLLYELKREKKKIVNKQKVSTLSLFVFSWFQAAPSTLSSAGKPSTPSTLSSPHFGCCLCAGCCWNHGLGEAVGLSPPAAHCTLFLQEYFKVHCLLTLFEIGFVWSELPLWRIPAPGGGFLNGCLRRD